MLSYEEKLSGDLDWALEEGSMHFDERSQVHQTLKRLAKKLEELQIPYAVAGGMALFSYGFRRFTEDVDLIVTAEGLDKIHQQLEGLGYIAPFKGARQLRDAESGVRIEFLLSGQFPGDGKPKPVAFPDPTDAGVEVNGVRFLRVERLVELKLASGMTNPGRLKDLADVQELIRVLKIPSEFQQRLDPYVRDKFAELWKAVVEDPGASD